MHYSVKTGACLLAMFVALQSSAFAQSHTEPGSGATYHYDDWRKQPPQEAFDVAPAPAEGMNALLYLSVGLSGRAQASTRHRHNARIHYTRRCWPGSRCKSDSIGPSLFGPYCNQCDQKDALDTSAKARCANRRENLFPAYI